MSERIRSYNIGNLNKEAENPTWRGFYNSRLLVEDDEDFDANYSSFQNGLEIHYPEVTKI